MTKKDFKDHSPQELAALYQDMSKELFKLRNEAKLTRKMEKPHLVREIKRNRARVMTILRQKELKAG